MTMTTIKVPADLRDTLKSQAKSHGWTLGDHLRFLAAEEDRRQRFEQLRHAMAERPPDEEYERELSEWQGDAWN